MATTPTSINRIRRHSQPATSCAQTLEGEALLRDMRAYRQEVTTSPAAARKFLVALGVLTPDGKPKRLTRG